MFEYIALTLEITFGTVRFSPINDEEMKSCPINSYRILNTPNIVSDIMIGKRECSKRFKNEKLSELPVELWKYIIQLVATVSL